jgi:hypothetical protein
MHYHVKGAFCIAVIICSFLWWIYDQDFPSSIAAGPYVITVDTDEKNLSNVPLLVTNLVFLYIIYLNGLMKANV